MFNFKELIDIKHFVILRKTFKYIIFSIIRLRWGGGVDIKHAVVTFGTCITYTFFKKIWGLDI
jgi:hypothetical protein